MAFPPSIIISGLGAYVPENCESNEALSKRVETNDEWIRSRTGIAQRYIAPEGVAASDLGCEAAKQAMERAGVKAEEIDLLIVGTMSPDYPFPATACSLQAKLGLRTIPAFDVHAACSGFVYVYEVAARMMQSGAYKHALIVGAEKMSSVVDWEDRNTCVLFGDGAGAAVLSVSDETGVGFVDSHLLADGNQLQLLYTPAGGSQRPFDASAIDERAAYLKMNGREIFKLAVRLMGQCCSEILEKNKLTPDQIALIVPHQANARIIDALGKHLGLQAEQMFLNIASYANTSAASIPIALEEAFSAGRIKGGDYILLVAFGGGLTWGASLIKWQHS